MLGLIVIESAYLALTQYVEIKLICLNGAELLTIENAIFWGEKNSKFTVHIFLLFFWRVRPSQNRWNYLIQTYTSRDIGDRKFSN